MIWLSITYFMTKLAKELSWGCMDLVLLSLSRTQIFSDWQHHSSPLPKKAVTHFCLHELTFVIMIHQQSPSTNQKEKVEIKLVTYPFSLSSSLLILRQLFTISRKIFHLESVADAITYDMNLEDNTGDHQDSKKQLLPLLIFLWAMENSYANVHTITNLKASTEVQLKKMTLN